MAQTELLGAWGEYQAAEYLRRKGYKILACNYHSRFGEIDIIARKRGVVAFVEVKLRKNAKCAYAREYVGSQKQMRVRTTAELWLAENGMELQPRFDVVEVYAPQGIETSYPQIVHFENAFQ